MRFFYRDSPTERKTAPTPKGKHFPVARHSMRFKRALIEESPKIAYNSKTVSEESTHHVPISRME